MSVSASAVPELNETNWMSWSSRMTARLRQLGLWRIIDESWEQPKLDLIVATKDTNGKVIALTAEQQTVNAKIKLDHGASLEHYLLAKEKAACDFTITMLDDELAIMAMLRALPREHYGEFVSALMRQKDLKCADVEAAFQVEQVERTTHHGPLVGSAALRTFGKPSSPRSDSDECPFCTIKGHAQEDCYKYKSARNNAIKLVNEHKADKCSGGDKRKGKANRAKVENEEVVEKAQRAQVRLAASPSSSADTHWIADTGATSHMTPHQSWFTSYCPHVIPICVANDAIVYSAGVGNVC
jgi:hypothetical protein